MTQRLESDDAAACLQVRVTTLLSAVQYVAGIGILRTLFMDCSIEDLYTSLRRRLLAFIARRTGRADFAEDVVQDTFVKLVSFCKRGGTCACPKSFVFRTAINVATDSLRKKSNDTLLEIQQFPADGMDKRLVDCLDLLVDRLPSPYREAVRLADIEKTSQKEIAARMGISHSGARTRVQRGRDKLRSLILETCEVEYDRYGNIHSCRPRH